MMAVALLDMMALDLGVLYLGGSTAFYDQPHEAQVEGMAWSLVRSGNPELSLAPVNYATLVDVWNDAHAKPKPAQDESAKGALMAHLMGG